MAKPKVGGTSPIRVELTAGEKYFWCTCGESSNQPWCDGSHKGSEFSPKMVTVEETKMYSMCTCQQSDRPEFCDGSHKTL